MTAPQLSVFALPGLPMIQAGDDLGALIASAIEDAGFKPADGDVFVIAQKIVSKAEGRMVNICAVEPTAEAIELAAAADKDPRVVQLILDESKQILRHKPGVIIAEHNLGFVLANAGLDRSNVDEDEDQVLLLPTDPDGTAAELRASLELRTDARLGVIIADSVGRAWRMGTTGMALGSAGVEALQNLRGDHDLYGRELQVSEHALADSIASAAELVIGEAAEATPVVIVRGLDQGRSEQTATELFRPVDEDLFR